MSELIWGVPAQRVSRKVEKFTTPVVTMAKIEEGKGRKFTFNKAAQESLGLVGGESHISFGFGEGTIAVMASENETANSFSLTKQCSISNKKTAEYIAKVSNLDTTVENYLHLEEVEGQSYMTVSHISNDNTPEEVNMMEEMDTKPMPEEVDEVAEEIAPEEAKEGVDVEGNDTNGAVFSAAGSAEDDEEETQDWD